MSDIKRWEPVYHRSATLASGIPLGGFGTGSVEIRNDGRFYDWEIFNNYQWSGNSAHPAPEMWSEDAFFALRVQEEGAPPRVRLLYDDEKRSKSVSQYYEHAIMYNYPFLRNVQGIDYSGRYPFATLDYSDPKVPLNLTQKAFTPFIPFNAKDSGLPLAYFVFEMENTSQSAMDVSLMFSLKNCAAYDKDTRTLEHSVKRGEGATCVHMQCTDIDAAERTAGQMVVGAMDEGATVKPAWTDGSGLLGFERVAAPALSQLFYPFRDEGVLDGEDETWSRTIEKREMKRGCGQLHWQKHQAGYNWRGAVCQKRRLEPGEKAEMVFFFSWYFPNHYHYFVQDHRLGHAYENYFSEALDVARYGVREFDRLHGDSLHFCESLYDGLEPWLAASFNAQLTTFPQSFWWTKSGDMAAWEGSACCQILAGAYTHWSSFQPLLFFPDVYHKMRERLAGFGGDDEYGFIEAEKDRRATFNRQKQEWFGGWLENRFSKYGYTEEDLKASMSSSDSKKKSKKKGGVREGSSIQILRDYMWTGDREFMRRQWPTVRENYNNAIAADENGDGLPDGAISWVTYDHWFLPALNSYKCTMWLVGLAAAKRIAELLDDTETAKQFDEVLQKGAKSFEERLWNGEYYDLAHDFKQDKNDAGCKAEQVSGQLYARLCGLGTIHQEDHARKALEAVHRYNLKDEEGLLNGTDPKGRDDWRYFARFSGQGDDESRGGQWVTPWTGTEYYVAATMLAEGMVQEGMDVLQNVYERHADMGMLYNHMECGEHYFRPMVMWACLHAMQGMVYDAEPGTMRFAPKFNATGWDTIFILPGSYGRIIQERKDGGQENRIRLERGELRLCRLEIEAVEDVSRGEVKLNGKAIDAEVKIDGKNITVTWTDCDTLKQDDELLIELQ
ncbi:MAG: GH116 family glycosyl-hydrolase [Candidatus Sumerlaeia bacterium]